ncbi:flippase [Candidatus Daviesbacteria bacterium]|nr:flippase [Candidatus Daviesbacteria bacterium]
MDFVLKQASWLFTAQVIARIISFFYVIFLARALEVSDYGLYTIALAYFSLVSSIADFGFSRFLTREVTRQKEQTAELLFSVSILRLTITSFIFALFAVFLYMVDPDKLRTALILLAIIAVIPQVLGQTFDAIFIAMQKLQFSAIALFCANLTTVLTGVYLVLNGYGVFGAINALIFGQTLFFISALIFLLKKDPHAIFSQVRLNTLKRISQGSLPYGLLAILGLLYFKVDVLMLTYMKGSYETGIYGAAFKFLEAIVFIPSSLAVALFPIMVKLHDLDKSKIKHLYFKSFKLMLLAGLFFMLVFYFVLPKFVKIYLPNYLASISVLKVLAFVIPFMFVHVPGAQILLATDKYLKQIIYFSLITLGFNIIANFIFIPKYGAVAAAWTSVASEILSFIIFFHFVRVKFLK